MPTASALDVPVHTPGNGVTAGTTHCGSPVLLLLVNDHGTQDPQLPPQPPAVRRADALAHPALPRPCRSPGRRRPPTPPSRGARSGADRPRPRGAPVLPVKSAVATGCHVQRPCTPPGLHRAAGLRNGLLLLVVKGARPVAARGRGLWRSIRTARVAQGCCTSSRPASVGQQRVATGPGEFPPPRAVLCPDRTPTAQTAPGPSSALRGKDLQPAPEALSVLTTTDHRRP